MSAIDNKAETIKTAIDTMIELIFDADPDEFTDGTKSRYDNCLATIEKLLLEGVGKDLPIGDEIAENRSYTGERIHNKIKADIRTTLKVVLYGEGK